MNEFKGERGDSLSFFKGRIETLTFSAKIRGKGFVFRKKRQAKTFFPEKKGAKTF